MHGINSVIVKTDHYADLMNKEQVTSKRKLQRKRIPLDDDSSSVSRSQQSLPPRRDDMKLEDGIVGFENNALYCYMNACLQCLLPISELRDHFLK